VAPIQLAIRLLIPAGSRLLDLDEIRGLVGEFDDSALAYPWKHSDEGVDQLCSELQTLVNNCEKKKLSRAQTFARVVEMARRAAGLAIAAANPLAIVGVRPGIPHLSEPWYCCAEPSGEQLAAIEELRKRIPRGAAFV
jgi:hypothetical protein